MGICTCNVRNRKSMRSEVSSKNSGQLCLAFCFSESTFFTPYFLLKRKWRKPFWWVSFPSSKHFNLCCQPSGTSPPPLLSCSYSSSQLEPRRDVARFCWNRAASRNFSLAKSTRLLWKKDFLQFQEIRFNKIKHIQRTKTLKTSEKNSSATPSSSLPQAAFQGRFWRPPGVATHFFFAITCS